MSYSVYVAHSRQSIEDIASTINGLLCNKTFAFVRAMNTFERERNQLRDNRLNLIIFNSPLTDEVVEDINQALHTVMKPFDWAMFKAPGKNENTNLHFRGFPRTMSKSDIVEYITDTLSYLNINDFKVDVALLDRGNSVVRGDGTIRFSDDVPIGTRNIVKLALDKTILTSDNTRHFVFCKWHRTADMRLPSVRNRIRNSFAAPAIEVASSVEQDVASADPAPVTNGAVQKLVSVLEYLDNPETADPPTMGGAIDELVSSLKAIDVVNLKMY